MKSLVITGDSLSYNRYGYDETPRVDAWNCHIGMQSWSFRIRNEVLKKAKGFKFADELKFVGKCEKGLGEKADLVDSIFGERVVTVTPVDNKISFDAESVNGKIVLYLQKRPQNYCRFSVSVDGVKQREKVDTFGESHIYHGFELFAVEFECGTEKTVHNVVLSEFDSADGCPKVTFAAVSNEMVNAVVTGQGGRTAKFINYHYDERIRKHNPDKLVIIFGGNDCLRYGTEEYEFNLNSILEKVKNDFPKCEILGITIPPSKLYTGDCNGKRFTTQEEFDGYISEYNSVFVKVLKKHGAEIIKTAEIFEDTPIEKWRFDEVHMTPFGNDLLFDTVCKKIF